MKRFLIILLCFAVNYKGYSQSTVAKCTDMEEKFRLIKTKFNDLVAAYKTTETSNENGKIEYDSRLDMCGARFTLKDNPKENSISINLNQISAPGTTDEYNALFENTIKTLNSVFADTHDPSSVMEVGSDTKTYFIYEKGKDISNSKRSILVTLSFIFGPLLSIEFQYTK